MYNINIYRPLIGHRYGDLLIASLKKNMLLHHEKELDKSLPKYRAVKCVMLHKNTGTSEQK